jgi:fatty-acid desaturase
MIPVPSVTEVKEYWREQLIQLLIWPQIVIFLLILVLFGGVEALAFIGAAFLYVLVVDFVLFVCFSSI